MVLVHRSTTMGVGLIVALIAGCSEGWLRKSDDDADRNEDGDDNALAGGGEGGMPAGQEQDPPPDKMRSEQGAGCSVENDCADGFSCIQGICQPVSFDIRSSAKECLQIDCADTGDCCGGLPKDVPDKCRSRASKCLEKLPGCVSSACTRASDCEGGGACTGNCSVSSGQCTGNADCLENKCLGGNCSLTFTDCSSDAECAANTCVGGVCDCDNPTFDPAEPVCQDEECEGLCLWACEGSRCVIPSDCQTDEHCFGSTPLCNDGACVQCTRSADCSFGKICLDGHCETACRSDSHCPLFEACDAGECIYVGCRSDRECTLIPALELLSLDAKLDPRLLRCNTVDGIGQCIVPCQTDAQCPVTEVCSGGVCEYIGCESDAECKTILGLHDQSATEETPWIPFAECREATQVE